MDKLKSIYASAIAASVSIGLTIVLTIVTEFSTGFKTWLAGFTGHHWVTKSWISILSFAILFIVINFTIKTISEQKTKKALAALQIFAVLGFIVILGFYSYEFLK